MCDELTLRDNENYLKERGQSGLTRRQLGSLAVGVGATMMLPKVANAQAVTESEIQVKTPDGSADCYFVHPSQGKHAGVIVWPDIFGLRTAFRTMGKRLAESGYSVLVVNPYYRTKKADEIPEGAGFDEVRALAGTLSAETHMTDAKAFVEFLDSQRSVDTSRQIGTTGYCMGGPIVMRTAAAVPDRIGAGASFHGGGLVSDSEDSPHLLIPTMQAQFLIAIAENDDERRPDDKNVLKESFEAAGLEAEIEVYAGAMHGWCPPDSRVYNKDQAERAWARLLVLFENALA